MNQEAIPLELGTQPCLRSSLKSETKEDAHLGTGTVPQLKPRVSERPIRAGEYHDMRKYRIKWSAKLAGKSRKMHQIYWGGRGAESRIHLSLCIRMWSKFLSEYCYRQSRHGVDATNTLSRAMRFQWEEVQLTWNPAVSSVAVISWSRGLPFWEGVGLCETDMARRGERSHEWDQPCPMVIGNSTNTFQNFVYFSRYACQRFCIWNSVSIGLCV